MRLKIVQAGEKVLRERARDLTPDEIRSASTRQLIELMRDTMHDAPGVGLAAPQVGVGLRLAVIEDRAEYLKDVPPADLEARERRPVPFHVIINPEIELIGDPVDFFEGCLSVAGFMGRVARSRRVRVRCLDENGTPQTIEAQGWYARILQHEIDHLEGTLYIDRMQTRTFTTQENYRKLPAAHK